MSTYDYMCFDIWVLRNKFAYNGECLIIFMVHREKDLVIWILLGEGRLQVLVQIRVQAFQRPQY